MENQSSAGSKHLSFRIIEQAFENAGLRYSFNEKNGYYFTELEKGGSDRPLLLVIESDPEVPEVVCYCYMASVEKNWVIKKLQLKYLAVIREYAAYANVRLERGFFKVLYDDKYVWVVCVVGLDYENARIDSDVVSEMIDYCANQMFNHTPAFDSVVIGSKTPDQAIEYFFSEINSRAEQRDIRK
jgi:hypothetical protein